jgi:hypothetical protein
MWLSELDLVTKLFLKCIHSQRSTRTRLRNLYIRPTLKCRVYNHFLHHHHFFSRISKSNLEMNSFYGKKKRPLYQWTGWEFVFVSTIIMTFLDLNTGPLYAFETIILFYLPLNTLANKFRTFVYHCEKSRRSTKHQIQQIGI